MERRGKREKLQKNDVLRKCCRKTMHCDGYVEYLCTSHGLSRFGKYGIGVWEVLVEAWLELAVGYEGWRAAFTRSRPIK